MARRQKVKRRTGKATQEAAIATRNRRTARAFLLTAAFVAGAAVMIIELTGNRVLAPWFGNSLYTWTGLIGVILVSVSGGYYLGGYLADKRPDYVVLSHLLFVSALWTMLVPLLAAAFEETLESMDAVAGPLLATAILFAAPGCLLAAVSPFAIRLISLLSDDKSVGVSAGSIGMLATLGSVVGTFGAGFVLVPRLQLHTIFLVTGLVLAVLAGAGYLLFYATARRRLSLAAAPVVLVALVATMVMLHEEQSSENVIHHQTTFYHRIHVVDREFDDGDVGRFLICDTTTEGVQCLKSGELLYPHKSSCTLIRLFCPHLERAAFLGGGAFTVPEAVLDSFPNARADVVEIDPAVIEVGRKFFRVDAYPRLHPVADDARRFLRNTNDRYDLIFGDAYHGLRCIPSHLVTREFFELVRSRLDDRGVYVMNVISAVNGDQAVLFRSILKTLSRVFEHQAVFLTMPEERAVPWNVFVIASQSDLGIDSLEADDAERRALTDAFLAGYLPPDRYDLADAVVLTDDYNPVEYLAAGMIRARR